MKPELISFDICPFVQRSVITLLHKDVDFDITYIDLADKPDWFLEISPLGKVPALKVGDEVLFESAVINEYLDDTTAPRLQHEEALARAKEKAWIEFGSAMLADLYQASVSADKEQALEKTDAFFSQLMRLEEHVAGGETFRASGFSLVDAAYAPLFGRTMMISIFDKDPRWQKMPKVRRWAEALLQRSDVQKSLPNDFEDKYKSYLKDRNAYVLTV